MGHLQKQNKKKISWFCGHKKELLGLFKVFCRRKENFLSMIDTCQPKFSNCLAWNSCPLVCWSSMLSATGVAFRKMYYGDIVHTFVFLYAILNSFSKSVQQISRFCFIRCSTIFDQSLSAVYCSSFTGSRASVDSVTGKLRLLWW